MTSDELDAKYLQPFTRRAVLRDWREGTRIWRIARDRRITIGCVKCVLIASGVAAIILRHPRERKTL